MGHRDASIAVRRHTTRSASPSLNNNVDPGVGAVEFELWRHAGFVDRKLPAIRAYLESAAGAGHPDAMYELAVEYLNEGNRVGAVRLLQESSNLGSRSASALLSKLGV